MRSVWIIGMVLTVGACGQEPGPLSDEREDPPTSEAFDPTAADISLEVSPQSETQVRFVVTTNLPTPVEVMAGIALAGQRPDDVFIGYSERITLDAVRNEFTLDVSRAREPLPSGEYDAEVTFYPRWGAENGNPAAASAPELRASERIALGGSGEDRGAAERRNELQRWVMENVNMNVPWNRANFESRLGPARKGPSTMSRLHNAYYFPDADMTLLVNRLRNEVTIWRMGDVTE